MKKWDEAELTALMTHFKKGLTEDQIAKKLDGRTPKAIRSRISKVLYEESQSTATSDLASMFDHTEKEIKAIIKEHTSSPYFNQQPSYGQNSGQSYGQNSNQNYSQNNYQKKPVLATSEIKEEVSKTKSRDTGDSAINEKYIKCSMINNVISSFITFKSNMAKLKEMKEEEEISSDFFKKLRTKVKEFELTESDVLSLLDNNIDVTDLEVKEIKEVKEVKSAQSKKVEKTQESDNEDNEVEPPTKPVQSKRIKLKGL